MSRKILILFGALFLIFFLGRVSSADMCWSELNSVDCESTPNGKVVMSLSDSTNAHGALAGQGTFVPVLCCNFGEGNTTCIADNKVLGLSASTNAHAEVPDLVSPNYNVDVCYDSLKNCRSTDVGCGINEIEVVYISNLTNAHIEAAGLQSQNYDTKICCVIDLPMQCDLTSATWQYEEVTKGTNVGAIVEGTGCSGEEISFEVFRDSTSCNDIDGCENPANVVFGAGENQVSGIWNASPYSDTRYSFVAKAVANPDETIPNSAPNLLVNDITPEYCELIVICNQYEIVGDCDSNVCGIDVQESVPSEINCSDLTINCSCSWNATISECGASWETGSEIGTCVYTQSTDDTCSDGFLTFSWTAEWIWDEGCDADCKIANADKEAACSDGSKKVECPAQIPLPFFNIYSLIAALVIIVLIYTVIISKKKK